ncbi:MULTISPECIES: AlpA family transcriptional regulator [Methylosinus]|uniref:Helix-turn-helix domain-containing protein n=1 Tax=Methylosinus sporium TaxID=428 RepID=A0A549SCZ2_METSR|nr:MULTISPECIES: helix-turn-helix domain-containing protein [Methylosinus]MBU3887194.1 helix-turn-helix domain-containing protein [Methylosinus sp. KRF6]MBY6243930.1 helix-turn-helix domain-containing protein [Methylosinus sp. Sm6]TRL23868.1 helix-turn-helix domain-containing protein [Methylosinus sporium]
MSSNQPTQNLLDSSVILDPVIAGLPRLLSVQETIRVLGIGRTKFYQMIESGEAPPNLVIGGKRLFAVDDVANWINAKKRQSAA